MPVKGIQTAFAHGLRGIDFDSRTSAVLFTVFKGDMQEYAFCAASKTQERGTRTHHCYWGSDEFLLVLIHHSNSTLQPPTATSPDTKPGDTGTRGHFRIFTNFLEKTADPYTSVSWQKFIFFSLQGTLTSRSHYICSLSTWECVAILYFGSSRKKKSYSINKANHLGSVILPQLCSHIFLTPSFSLKELKATYTEHSTR